MKKIYSLIYEFCMERYLNSEFGTFSEAFWSISLAKVEVVGMRLGWIE